MNAPTGPQILSAIEARMLAPYPPLRLRLRESHWETLRRTRPDVARLFHFSPTVSHFEGVRVRVADVRELLDAFPDGLPRSDFTGWLSVLEAA